MGNVELVVFYQIRADLAELFSRSSASERMCFGAEFAVYHFSAWSRRATSSALALLLNEEMRK